MPVTTPLLIPRLHAHLPGIWSVPGSKSITNRAYVLAALSPRTVLHNALTSDDTARMHECLVALGVSIAQETRRDPATIPPVTILGGVDRLRPPGRDLFVGNSGTTVRFLAALATLVAGEVRLVGDQAMARRPLGDLVDGLRQLRVSVDCPTDCPPLTVHGGTVTGTSVSIHGNRSSQYISALMMAAGCFQQDLDIHIIGELVSRPYLTMTRAMVGHFGGRIDETPTGFHVHGRRRYAYQADAASGTSSYHVEPDASSASYPFALAAAGRTSITVPGLGRSSLQGDIAFIDVLARMGARVETGTQLVDGQLQEVTTITGPEQLSGIEVDMHDISDTVMTLAAIAPLCTGPTTISNIANIRIKETDRLAATVQELRRLGQEVTHGDDWLRIQPRPLIPATVECYHDHRMAMSFAILGALHGGVSIADPSCTSKTYPGFWHDLARQYPHVQRPAW